ncbi:MAG: hypothetical protein ACXWCZ_14440, partial [Flavisolibacter sp.]
GSVGNLVYVANGDKSLPKEHIEIFGAGQAAAINDFQNGSIHRGNRMKKMKSAGKGHKQEVAAFMTSISEGKDSPIDFRSICLTTLTTFKIIDSLKTGLPQEIVLNA